MDVARILIRSCSVELDRHLSGINARINTTETNCQSETNKFGVDTKYG